jgi:hypothetical protein
MALAQDMSGLSKTVGQLESQCGFVMPDIIFDIETGWNRRNILALEQAGYVFVYRQRGHIFDEPQDALLPLRKIGAGQFIAVSDSVWQQLGRASNHGKVFLILFVNFIQNDFYPLANDRQKCDL